MASFERWHVAKTITVGNLLTGMAALAAIALWVFNLENRVTVVESKVLEIGVVREEVRDGINSVIIKLDGIEDKQYRHLENHPSAANPSIGN
jgi:hypothetical protein